MSKKIALIVVSLLILALIFIKGLRSSSQEEGMITIGILQTATHPALDQSREGFQEEMLRLYGDKVNFVVQNAEGSLSQAQSIAENFHTQKKITAIYAIATPALQAAARAEKTKPILIAAVSYPESLGVLSPGTNVAGASGRVNVASQTEMIKTLFPKTNAVAIIYNPGEHNSQMMVQEMQESLSKKGISAYLLGINSESEIAQSVAIAARKGDLILLPTDNMLASAISLVSKEALKKKIPLIASDITLVEKGAPIAQGMDYYESGKVAAKQAYRILTLKESPEQVGIIDPVDSQIYINQEALNTLQINIPEEMKSQVKIIEGGNHGS